MNGFETIMAWLDENVKMHAKRRTTLGYLVTAAMMVRGLGVLALGRAVDSGTTAKHAIKRTWRFLRNPDVECTAVHEALFRQFCPKRGPVVVLVDWTDLYPYTQLVFALPRDGRALPFLSKTIYKEGGEGSRIAAETWALEAAGATTLVRGGIAQDEVEPGDTIHVRCHPLRDGSNGCLLGFVTTSGGVEKEWD